MEIAQHLLARFGPPLLMLMGMALCLARLLRSGRLIGAAVLLAVGVPVSVAAFLETRPVAVSNHRGDAGAHTAIAPHTAAHEGGSATERERRARLHSTHPVGTVFVAVPETLRQNAHRGLFRARSNRTGPRRVVLVIPAQRLQAPRDLKAAAANSKIPPNTLSCAGFTRDADGEWEAGDDTTPFDVGSATNYTIRDEGPIRPGWISVGGVDLYALLNAKCRAAAVKSAG